MSRRSQVGALAIGEQIECLPKGVLDIGEGSLSDFDVALGLVDLGGEPVLLMAQQIDGDGPGVIGMKQLLALLGELGETLSLAGGLGFSLLAHPTESVAQLAPHPLGLFARQPHIAVGVLHRGLDQVDGYIGLLAAGATGAPETVEVGIAPTVALRVGKAHPRAAAAAVEGTLQVVVVLSVLL